MNTYQFDLPTSLRLRGLADEYGRMDLLAGMSPQARGRRLNFFIADLLSLWGLDPVSANVRGVGEVDVTFAVDRHRFILEAKWEQAPADFGYIAKLRGRITQRLAGTQGVFLSMNGYTAEALGDMLRGQQPDMVLLDRTHLEAMLSGLLSPNDLFTQVLDRAAYRGDVYVPIRDLILSATQQAPPPPMDLGGEPNQPVPVVGATAPGVQAVVILHGRKPLESMADGIAVDTGGRLLLTMPDGIARIDPVTGQSDWAVPIPGCRSHALALTDDSILAVKEAAVLRWHDGDVQIIAGGFTGGTSLLSGPGGEVWVFDYKGAAWLQAGLAVTLSKLGATLGQEERHVIDFRAGIWSAVWLSGRRFYLAGDGHFGVVDLDQSTTVAIDDRLRSPHPDQRGSMRLDDLTVLTASRHGTVYRIDVRTGRSTRVADLDMLPLGCDLATGPDDSAYILEHRGGPRAFVPIVVRLSGFSAART